MYKMNKKLLDRTLLNQQTMANNANPQMITHIQRASLPITSSRYWEVLDCGATVMSVAVRRPVAGQLATEVWRALKLSDGIVKIQKAVAQSKLIDMVWRDVTSLAIDGMTITLLQFDGMSVTRQGIKETITVGETPYVIAAGMSDRSEIYKVSNTGCEFVCSFSSAGAVSTVRGEYGAAVEDGILIFYIDSDGKLHEVSFINNEIVYDNIIDFYPEGMSAWVDVRANTTFDYRIVLQLQTADNQVYSLFSQSRSGGEMINENISVTVHAAGRIMVNKFLNVIDVRYNITDDDVKAVYVTFDDNVTLEGETDPAVWSVVDYADRVISFAAVEKYSDNTIILIPEGTQLAEDIALPYTLNCSGAEYIINDMGNSLGAFDYKFINDDYWRGHTTENISVRCSAEGEIIPLTRTASNNTENISVSKASGQGDYITVTYPDVYEDDAVITVQAKGVGNIYNIADVPV